MVTSKTFTLPPGPFASTMPIRDRSKAAYEPPSPQSLPQRGKQTNAPVSLLEASLCRTLSHPITY